MLLPRKSDNSSVEILDYPARNGKILRKFDFILPKFHFILPNFYFGPPWGIFVCSVEIPDFLGRNLNCLGNVGKTGRSLSDENEEFFVGALVCSGILCTFAPSKRGNPSVDGEVAQLVRASDS